jgi:cysteinyl-tRNA synthetase
MRREKRWSEADSIRQKMSDAGYEIEDTPQGPKIKSRKLPAIT